MEKKCKEKKRLGLMKTKIRKQLSSKKLKEIRFLFCPTKNKNKG